MTNVRKDEEVALKREIEIQSEINHPNIIKLLASHRNGSMLYLVQELGERGNLFHLMKRSEIPIETALKVFVQILSAVSYLHKRGFIHRDIKPENILMTKSGDFKLCDFGFSASFIGNEVRMTLCGTKEYLAPEVLDSTKQSDKLDIWCLGVLLYELIHKRPPYSVKSVSQLKEEILKKKVIYKKDINP